MKRLLSTEFTVGTFALLGLWVIIYMSLEVNDRGAIGDSAHTYYGNFETVTGLVRKVPVEVAGITAGFVDDISLQNARAKVKIRVREDIPVYADASLTVRDRGILGDRYVQLNPGSPNLPQIPNGGEITKTYSQADFERLTAAMSETAEIIKELVAADEPRGAIGKVIVNLRDMTGQLRDIVGENDERIQHIVANLEAFSTDLKEISGENKDDIHNTLVAMNDVATAMKKAFGEGGSVQRATEKLDETMTSMREIVAKVERGEGSLGKLINDDTTVNNLNETLEGVNNTMGLFGRVQLGIRYRAEFLTSDEELQNLIGITVAPSPDKYLLFEIVDTPGGETKVVNTQVTSGGTVLSETQTVQTDDKILFTFMLAKRFWDTTFRFGLIRNEGGVGFDYHLLKDKLLITFEAFNFSRFNDRPQLRGYGTLIVYKHLLFTGGMDDMITQRRGRNAFFGLGLQFTDNDLKALLTTVGGRL